MVARKEPSNSTGRRDKEKREEKNVIADALSRLDANFNEKLPREPTNDSMAYIFLTKMDI